MAYLPDYGRGYAVMINSGSGQALNEIGKLVRQYPIRDLTPPPLPPAASVPAEIQQHYAGYYQGISPRMQMFYAVERLINFGRLVFSTKGLIVTTYNLHHDRWVPVTERLFRRENQSVATLALVPDADGQILIQTAHGTYKQVPALRVWGQRLGTGVISLLMLSSPLYALVWGTRKLLGKLRNAGPLSVRAMPLLGTLALGGFLGLFYVNQGDAWTLGVCSWVTVGIMFSSIIFALAAAASLYFVYRERQAAMNRLAYWHSVLVAAAVAVVALYMGYWGLIGLRLWV
ncbi:MAG TPA: hypothetical protein VG077_19340 [Verrucomicrobiae bacterium]|nr:hypothetical protein [Verrucomicrobiae bacterium]